MIISLWEWDYVAMGDAVKLLKFARQVPGLLQPGHKQKRLITEFEDNERAITMTKNSLGSAGSKYIHVHHHYLRELLAKKAITMTNGVDSEKALGQKLFVAHQTFLLDQK